MSYEKFFWSMFEKSGSVDAYLGYNEIKKQKGDDPV